MGIGLALPLSLPASAGETESEGLTVLDEIVVTATKTEEKRKDVPNAVILKDAMDIKDSAATSLGDLLGNEMGIDWRTYGDYGGALQYIQIRGMDEDGTQVRVNGFNIAPPSSGSLNIATVPLNNIERIEVVKGSGSLLYGTGAMAGTVNIITKSPRREKNGS